MKTMILMGLPVLVMMVVVFQEFELDLLEWVEGEAKIYHQMANCWIWVVRIVRLVVVRRVCWNQPPTN